MTQNFEVDWNVDPFKPLFHNPTLTSLIMEVCATLYRTGVVGGIYALYWPRENVFMALSNATPASCMSSQSETDAV